MKGLPFLCFMICIMSLISGCGKFSEDEIQSQLEQGYGGWPDVDITDEMISADLGKEGKGQDDEASSDEIWCEPGKEWSMTGSAGDVQMRMEGIIKEGMYQGYCHITSDPGDADATIDYYIDEGGRGYRFEMVE